MKIGLVLSGGGVLGAAHLGTLKQLEDQKIKVHSICGSSAGAIVGALYAIGGTKAIEAWVQDLVAAGLFDRKKIIFNLKLNPDKIFDLVKKTLYKHIGDRHFYELPIKFSCVATDLVEGQSVLLSHGLVLDAVMASSAYPGVFQPVKIKDRYYIDGGITKNFPVSMIKSQELDFIIGSSLYNVGVFKKIEEGLKTGRLETAVRALDIMQKQLADFEKDNCDFCFEPPVEEYQWFSFNRFDEIKKIGEEYADANINRLILVLRNKGKKTFWDAIMHNKIVNIDK